MAADTDVTNGMTEPGAQGTTELTDTTPGSSGAVTPEQQPNKTLPTSPLTREHAEAAGRRLVAAFGGLGKVIAQLARAGARMVRRLLGVAAVIPPAVRALGLSGLGLLMGIVGALAWHGSAGLLCIVVVIPICSMVLGALGYRFYALPRQLSTGTTESAAAPADTTRAQNSLQYVDRKLTFALHAFGAQRNQHAMVALFQAKTAMELALGTEQDADIFSALDDHPARPRIRPGSASKTLLHESNSLAAS